MSANPTMKNAIERFYSFVTIDDKNKCWPWTGALDNDGYGVFWGAPKYVRAHRFSYELNVGPIPEGLTLDHVKARGCTMRSCVNPSHLEPVTNAVNVLRGDGPPAQRARQTTCKYGHPFDSKRVGHRVCLTCNRGHQAKHRAKRSSLVHGAIP